MLYNEDSFVWAFALASALATVTMLLTASRSAFERRITREVDAAD
jgi:ABC-type sulfate transport system permease subunit